MRILFACAVTVAAAGPSCSNSTPPTGPTSNAAVIVARAPASVAARACTGCGANSTELEAAFDVVVEETAGVAGQITAVDVVLRTGSVVIAGPAQFDAAAVSAFGGGTNRVTARGSLTLRSIGVHFGPQFRPQLPATLTMVVRFRDDRGNTASAESFIQVTP